MPSPESKNLPPVTFRRKGHYSQRSNARGDVILGQVRPRTQNDKTRLTDMINNAPLKKKTPRSCKAVLVKGCQQSKFTRLGLPHHVIHKLTHFAQHYPIETAVRTPSLISRTELQIQTPDPRFRSKVQIQAPGAKVLCPLALRWLGRIPLAALLLIRRVHRLSVPTEPILPCPFPQSSAL